MIYTISNIWAEKFNSQVIVISKINYTIILQQNEGIIFKQLFYLA